MSSPKTYPLELRKLLRVDLLIIDDVALQSLDQTETQDFYEIVVERHQVLSTIVTSPGAGGMDPRHG